MHLVKCRIELAPQELLLAGIDLEIAAVVPFHEVQRNPLFGN